METTPNGLSVGIRALRWLAFLPVGAVLIAVAQWATVTTATHFAWWISAPLIIFFGAVIAGAGYLPATIAPNPVIGCTILLTLFLLFEGIALASSFSAMALYPMMMRIYADATIVLGAVFAAKLDKAAA
jgi:hypothetical protein